MDRLFDSNRALLGSLFLATLGALAMLILPTMAAAKPGDRNHDGLPDRWEKRNHLSLKVKQGRRDQDRDKLRNRAEFLAGTSPRDSDSDDDGVADNGENAGTIESFSAETGVLAIDLFGRGTVSGLVTDETEIECEDDGHATATASHGGGDSDDGDDDGDSSGPGSPSSGHDGDDDGDDDAGDRSCGVADLVPGAVVQEAELELANGEATFEEVELAG